MKNILIAIFVISALAFAGCKSAKKSDAVEISNISSVTDTISVSSNINSQAAYLAEASLEVSNNSLLRKIDFVETGGEVRVDSNGAVTLRGVRSADMSLAAVSVANRNSDARKQTVSENSRIQSRHVEDASSSATLETEEIPYASSKSSGGLQMSVIFIIIALISVLLWRKSRR